MSKLTALRFLHISNHLLVVWGLCFHWNLYYLLGSLLIYCFIGCLGISIGYHRYLSHKSFQPEDWFKFTCLFFGMIATGGSPLSWVAAHRVHHLYADTNRDVHNLKRDGFFKVYFHFWHPFTVSRRMVHDLLMDRWISRSHKYYFLFISVYAGLLYTIGFENGVYIYSLPAVMAFHFYGLINVLGHSSGARHFNSADTSTNNWLVNCFTFGEGWHQNHHILPSSYRIGFRKGEFDLSAWILENLPAAKDRRRLLQKRARYSQVLHADSLPDSNFD